MESYGSCQHLALGAVLDGKYCLISQLSSIDGRPRFVAEDLVNNREVELIVLSGASGPQGYNIRPCKPVEAGRDASLRLASGPANCLATNQRAMTRFTERFSLTGVRVRDSDRLVFSAWDHKLGKPVRVVVEEDDT